MVNHLHCSHGSDSCSVCSPGQVGLGNVGPQPMLLHGSISVKMTYFVFTLIELRRFLSACVEPVVVPFLSDTDHLLSLSFPFTLQSVVASPLLVHYLCDQYSLP